MWSSIFNKTWLYDNFNKTEFGTRPITYKYLDQIIVDGVRIEKKNGGVMFSMITIFSEENISTNVEQLFIAIILIMRKDLSTNWHTCHLLVRYIIYIIFYIHIIIFDTGFYLTSGTTSTRGYRRPNPQTKNNSSGFDCRRQYIQRSS